MLSRLHKSAYFIERNGGDVGFRRSASIQVPAANLAFYVDWIWRLGDHARIVELQEAVQVVRDKIDAIRAQYDR